MKFSSAVNFINVKCARFSYKHHFSSFFLVTFTRKIRTFRTYNVDEIDYCSLARFSGQENVNTRPNVAKIGSKIIISFHQSKSATHSVQCFSSLIDYQHPKLQEEQHLIIFCLQGCKISNYRVINLFQVCQINKLVICLKNLIKLIFATKTTLIACYF